MSCTKFKKNNELTKAEKIINYLEIIENEIKNTESSIQLLGIIYKYAADNNRIELLKTTTNKLESLNLRCIEDNKQRIKNLSNSLNNQVLKNVKESFQSKINSDKRRFIIVLSILLITFILFIYLKNKKNRLRREKLITDKNNQIVEKDQKNLQQNIDFQNAKIKNLHYNLSLKVETEKAFLENLKIVKKTKNKTGEELIKELLFQVNNLVHIDNRNVEIMAENDFQNKIFIEKLAQLHPI